MEDREFQERIQRIEELVRRLEKAPDAALRATAQELLQGVMDLHGRALDRMLTILSEHEVQAAAIIDVLGRDELVGNVLLLHGLHPEDLETRIQGALEKIESVLRGYGARAKMLGAPGGNVRLEVSGVRSAPEARATKTAIEEALYQAAPDVASLTVLGLQQFSTPDFVSLEALRTGSAGASNGFAGRAATEP
jgi:hypothetical protein